MEDRTSETSELWIDRSRQRWKLEATWAGPGLTAVGVYLFFRATWPEVFYGLVLGVAGAPFSIALASLIRCRVCDHRVALDAGIGKWFTYLATLRRCPRCGDPGDARPVQPGELSVWQQAARTVAARERGQRRSHAVLVFKIVAAAAVAGVALVLALLT